MAGNRWNVVATLVACSCVACAGGGGPDASETSGVDASRSKITIAPSVEMQGDTATAPVTIQVRNTAGAPLAGVAVQLTASGAALPATIAPPTGTTDASGTFSASVTAVTWGRVTVSASLGAAAATLTATIDVTCTPGASVSSWISTTLSAVRQRTLADGQSAIRLLVGGQAFDSMVFTNADPVANVCFRLTADRDDVVLTPRTGRTGGSGAPSSVDVTSARPGPAVVTATTPFGAATVAIEFVTTPAWSRVGGSGPDAPGSVTSVTKVPPGERLVAFGEGQLRWSSDGGGSWQPSTVAGMTLPSRALSEMYASPTVPDLVMARIGSDLLRSTDAGHSFTRLGAATALRVHPSSGAWLMWTGTGSPFVSPPAGDAWTSLPSPVPSTWTISPVAVLYAASSSTGGWIAFVVPSTTNFSSGSKPTLALWTPGGSWVDVTGSLVTALLGQWFEAASWTGADLAADVENAATVFASAKANVHIGPGAYGTSAGAWGSVDGGSSWSSSPPWPGRLFPSSQSGIFHVDTNGIAWKHTQRGIVDASVGLPEGVQFLSFDHARPGTIYAATPSGLYVTSTAGE